MANKPSLSLVGFVISLMVFLASFLGASVAVAAAGAAFLFFCAKLALQHKILANRIAIDRFVFLSILLAFN
jgi:hypothetical protein